MPIVPGLYDAVLTRELEDALARMEGQASLERLPESVSAEILARHAHDRLLCALAALHGPEAVEKQRALVNDLYAWLRDRVPEDAVSDGDELAEPARRLLSVVHSSDRAGIARPPAPPRPLLPLRESGLLVNGHREPNFGPVLCREIESADRIDLICAFLRQTGLNLIRAALRTFFDRGGSMRVLTGVYLGATERRAIDALATMGADVKVSYEAEQTRLHAKSWLLHRRSGFSTAFIGSSNLSRGALIDGLEWNVRLSAIDNAGILDRFRATFDQYWEETSFEAYEPARDGARLDAALAKQRQGRLIVPLIHQPWDLQIDVAPKEHQRAILDQLAAERELGRSRNLVVAATGTGKTWVAAFDYERLLQRDATLPSLLFVAHRQEILQQSLRVYQVVLRRPEFGELLVGGEEPRAGRHVFASIQSLHADRVATIPPHAFDIVVIDEFHHAAAPTYDALLRHLEPKVLLGLTATPERADGVDILHHFDGHIAAEVRLWQALDERLLCPFHYYGVSSGMNLSGVRWQRGRYDLEQLQSVYSGYQYGAREVMQAVGEYVADPRQMKALGFCVGVSHAQFMADFFSERGLPALALTGETPDENRRSAVSKLRSGELCAVFTVDLFNEGVDIPEMDTALFLRPTESATVFLQQLGRGLRRVPGKTVLTVLDFIGNAHREFQFAEKYRAILGGTRRDVLTAIESGFPFLPAGCGLQFDRVAQDIVVGNIRASLQRAHLRHFADDLRAMGPGTTLRRFLDATGLELEDLYPGGWTAIRRTAGFEARAIDPLEQNVAKAFGRMLHVDDPLRLRVWSGWARAGQVPALDRLDRDHASLRLMLAATLGKRNATIEELHAHLDDVFAAGPVRDEFSDLLDCLDDRARSLTIGLPDASVPLRIHGRYSRSEVMAALGIVANGRLRESREGVVWNERTRTDVLFVTLDKSDGSFTETTRYADYPISHELFHWESQSTTTADSPTGRRYREHAVRGSSVWLFVRERREGSANRTLPYLFLGPCEYVTHESERPMRITWRLRYSMPASFYQQAKVAAG